MNEQDRGQNGPEESFEQMLESSLNRRDGFDVGERVNGTVVAINGDSVFVDISGKSEAIIEASEFRNAKGEMSVKTGDRIDAYVVSTGGGEVRLTSSLGKGSMNQSLLELAYKSKIPVHGSVTGMVKGGYSVSVSGKRCFCPLSQIDIRQPASHEEMIGKSFSFKIIEYREKGGNIILSRRALLEEVRDKQEQALKETLRAGDTVKAEVRSVKNFGLFVDIGGVEGMVPRSELSRSRGVEPAAFSPGQEITASVKSIDWDAGKITLSIKDCSDDPWETIDRYQAGSEIQATIVNIIRNGAFAELEPGLEGFIPLSRLNLIRKVNRVEDILGRGDRVTVRIAEINRRDRKISLDLVTDGPNPWKDDSGDLMKTVLVGTVEAVTGGGLNVRLSNGMLGYVPKKELACPPGTDIQKKYAAGSEIRVAAVNLKQDEKRLVLSETAALRKEEREDYEKFMGASADAGNTSLGSLFKNQFDRIQKKIDDRGTP